MHAWAAIAAKNRRCHVPAGERSGRTMECCFGFTLLGTTAGNKNKSATYTLRPSNYARDVQPCMAAAQGGRLLPSSSTLFMPPSTVKSRQTSTGVSCTDLNTVCAAPFLVRRTAVSQACCPRGCRPARLLQNNNLIWRQNLLPCLCLADAGHRCRWTHCLPLPWCKCFWNYRAGDHNDTSLAEKSACV